MTEIEYAFAPTNRQASHGQIFFDIPRKRTRPATNRPWPNWTLVGRMESGQLPLDQLLDSYRRGRLAEVLPQRLQAVEEQVKLLEDGQLKPWDRCMNAC
jgi:exodeoxyribonuclease VII small subunit